MTSVDDATPRSVAVIASCMMDMITNVTRMPELGETLRGNAFHLGFGGKGANQAVMAAGVGAQVSVVARVGDDIFGRMTIENFEARGIATDYVTRTPGATTGVAPIIVRDDGANIILIVPGANDALTPADVVRSRDQLSRAAVVISQLEIPQEASIAAFRLAKSEGAAMTMLNPAPAAAITDELLRYTDVLMPNEVELSQLTGAPCSSLEEVKAAARSLANGTDKTVVVTLGERGAMSVDGDRAVHFGAYPVRALDTTGAGDAFVGALAARLASGATLESAIDFANAAAALSTQKSGTQVSFPDRASVDDYLRSLRTTTTEV